MKTERIWFKALPDDKQTLERIAQVDGESMAVIMRRLIREEAQRRGLVCVNNQHKVQSNTATTR